MTLSPDTSPEAERVQIELLRQATTWRKLHLLAQMNHALRTLALSGLRQRYPDATPDEWRRRLADLWLGPDLAARVYGPPPYESDGFRSGDGQVLDEPIAVTLLVVDALEALGAPYLIGGSLASAVHGVLRTTMDADIVAELRLDDAELLVRALGSAFYADVEAIRDAIRRQSSFSVIHLETIFKVDVFVRGGRKRPFDQAQFERRERHVLSGEPERTAYIASAEDTILAKLEWYRLGDHVSERQWRDVQGVLKVQAGRLDYAYLRRWAASLGVTDLLERAVGEAGIPA